METGSVITHLKDVCNLFGYPSTIVTDHGTQYLSKEFKELCMQFNIVHQPATPHSQWQNGRCENTIGKLKMLLEKSKREEDLTLEYILLAVRDTPFDNNTPPPFELMFHRKVKTDLPSIPLSLLDTSSSITAGTRTVKHAEYKNQTRSEPCKLEENKFIMFQKNPQSEPIKWSSGKVTSIDGERSYIIRDTKTGAEYSRNRLHLKPKPSMPATLICPDP